MKNGQLIEKLYEIQAIKFGSFTLKSGIISPIYLDLRMAVSYPSLLEGIAQAIWQEIHPVPCDLLCGVPYTALPIATAISLKNQKPMVMRRKEAKGYGTNKMIEGHFQAGQTCLVIEDLVTSASSIFETMEALEAQELTVNDAAVLIDREQGGFMHLKKHGVHLHAAFTLTHLLEFLLSKHLIDALTVTKVKNFIKDNQTSHPLENAK